MEKKKNPEDPNMNMHYDIHILVQRCQKHTLGEKAESSKMVVGIMMSTCKRKISDLYLLPFKI